MSEMITDRAEPTSHPEDWPMVDDFVPQPYPLWASWAQVRQTVAVTEDGAEWCRTWTEYDSGRVVGWAPEPSGGVNPVLVPHRSGSTGGPRFHRAMWLWLWDSRTEADEDRDRRIAEYDGSGEWSPAEPETSLRAVPDSTGTA